MSQLVVEDRVPVGVDASLAALAKPRWMPYGDMIRILGTVAVVCGHCCDMVLFKPHAELTQAWWVCNIYDAMTRWAVPAYVMLSGALLLDPARRESPMELYRKRLWRIGIPLVFWSVFFMLFSVYYTGWCTPRDAWLNLLRGKPYVHMHFIFRIAGLYAFTPMFRVFLRHSTRAMQMGTVIALLCVWSADSVANGFDGTEYSGFIGFAPFIGYYLAGYLLRDPHPHRSGLAWCWVGLIASMAVLAGGTGLLVQHYGMKPYPSMGMSLYDFLSPVRVVMAICAWMILVHQFSKPFWHSGSLSKVTRWVANTTLGLYLVHPVFREILKMHQIDAAWPNVWVGVPLVTTLVYIPALVTTVILMKIPYVRRITG